MKHFTYLRTLDIFRISIISGFLTISSSRALALIQQDEEISHDSRKGALEFGIGYGSSNRFALERNQLAYDLISSNWWGPFYESEYSPSVVWTMDYRQPVGKKIDLSFGAAYQKIHEKAGYLGNWVNGYHTFTTISFGVYYVYLEKQTFQLYSGVLMGMTIGESTFNDFEPHMEEDIGLFKPQVNLIGIRIGDSVAFKSEIGWGPKGDFQLGVSKRF